MLDNFKLCYISGDVAMFTTQAIDKQWGDDFNDAPYDCNAGEPYEPTVFNFSDGTKKLCLDDWNVDKTPKWQLLTVRFSGSNLVEPCMLDRDDFDYPSLSVENINNKVAPWLTAKVWDGDAKCYSYPGKLYAGATVSEFIAFVEQYGGTVWVPRLGLETTITPAARPDLEFHAK